MTIASLIIQSRRDNVPDDVISFDVLDDSPGLFEVTYSPSDLPKTKYRFYMTFEDCQNYVYRTLKLLSLDNHPFGYVQVTTRINPTVIFEIPDLDDGRLRETIENIVATALRTHPVALKA